MNRVNKKTNTHYQQLLSFLQEQPEADYWWSPRVLASPRGVNLNYGSVRRVVRKLLRDGLVVEKKAGIATLYAAAKHFTGDFVKLVRQYGLKSPLQIHGLTMKLEAKSLGLEEFPEYLVNIRPVGGGSRGNAGRIRERFVESNWRTTFQLSRETLMVWCKCTDLPMDYSQWVLWLKGVDIWLHLKGWTRIEGNLCHWKVLQPSSINRDFKAVRVDSGFCVTLQCFDEFLARVYHKPSLGKNMARAELELQKPIKMEKMVKLLTTGMEETKRDVSLDHFTDSLNLSNSRQVDIMRELGKVKDAVSGMQQKMKGMAKRNREDGSELVAKRLDWMSRTLSSQVKRMDGVEVAILAIKNGFEKFIAYEEAKLNAAESKKLPEDKRRELYG